MEQDKRSVPSPRSCPVKADVQGTSARLSLMLGVFVERFAGTLIVSCCVAAEVGLLLLGVTWPSKLTRPKARITITIIASYYS